MSTSWYALKNTTRCHSPSLLVYPERIAHNIRLMIQIAGGPDSLRPHIKTHKTLEIIRMQQEAGIQKFKCATIAEAELLARAGVPDVLLALQPVGYNLERFMKLQQEYPETLFSTILDDEGVARQLNELSLKSNRTTAVYMDINVGMDRTGIAPGEKGREFYKILSGYQGLRVKGFHVYDGHIRDNSLEERTKTCNTAFAPVLTLKSELESQGYEVGSVIAGGSPTFPVHARRAGIETSPGTTLLWDDRYESSFPDLPFLPAAVLLSRVISKPSEGLLCLDLGHKALAPEMPFPRVRLLGMEGCEQLSQSEEHLVIRCPNTENYKVGEVCYAVPVHICPTVAKYPEVFTVEEGEITGSWKVAARDHRLTI